MASPGTHSDGLRLQLAGVDVISLRTVGAIAGVVVLSAAGRNGPGAGQLLASDSGLSWQSPGSSTPGNPVPIVGDGGVYLLEDGTDPSSWLRVQAYASRLATSGAATVELADRFDGLFTTDVSAANASAGLTETVQFTITNVTPAVATNVTLWLDLSAVTQRGAGLSISSDGTNFYAPTAQSDPTALTWASIAGGSSANVWLRRTIAAGASSNPQITNIMRLAWNGV